MDAETLKTFLLLANTKFQPDSRNHVRITICRHGAD